MKQQEQYRARAKMCWVTNKQVQDEMMEQNNSTLVSRINDRQSRRNFELSRQVSLAREKNMRQKQKYHEISIKI